MSTATMPAPRRISTLQYVKAAFAVRIGLEPEHEGATPEWAEFLRSGLTDRPAVSHPDTIATAFVPPARRPAIALADVPYELVDDEDLGVLPIGPLVPAHLFDEDRYNALIGATA